MNRIQTAALGIWLVWIGYLVLFPNWQEAAQYEKEYRKGLGVHFVLKPPAPVAVPCYFVGCVTAPASYFRVVMDRKNFYPSLSCVTVLLIVTLLLVRARENGVRPSSIVARRMRLVATVLITLALPVPGAAYFPLGVLVEYMPMFLLHPDHDHIAILIGFVFFFTIYGTATYYTIGLAIWASTSMKRWR